MNPFSLIRSWFIWATQVLVQAALDCYYSPLLPDFLGDAFNFLSDFTAEVAGDLWTAANWYDQVMDRLGDILSWSTVQALVRNWLPGIESLTSWWASWWDYVLSVINSWWTGALGEVEDLIAAVMGPVDDLLASWTNFWNSLWPSLVDQVNNLSSSWSSFWTSTLPDLVSFSWLESWWTSRIADVSGLIDSAFSLRESLWSGWQDMRDQVGEFFTDPWGWLYNRLDDFIERYW